MKNLTLIFLLLLTLFSACKKNSLSDIENRPYSQFENSTVEGAVTKVRFADRDTLIDFIPDNDTIPVSYTTTLSVNLFGAPLNHDVIVDYEIVDTFGVKLNREFTLSDTKFIIPAGSLTGSIDITISNSEMPGDSLSPFLLKLKNVQGSKLDTFYKTNTVKLYKTCLLDYENFAGIYNLFFKDLDMGYPQTYEGYIKIELFTDNNFPNGLLLTGNLGVNENDTFRINLEPDGTLSVPFGSQIINYLEPDDPDSWVKFIDFRSNYVENCKPTLIFIITPWVNGSWLTGDYRCTLEKISDIPEIK